MNQNNLLSLDLTKFTFDQTKYKTPTLHETWKWEGDETVLPYKWVNLIKCQIYMKIKEKHLILK